MHMGHAVPDELGWCLDGTTGLPSRKKASDEYANELSRLGRKRMPITRRSYTGLPLSKRT